MCTRQVCTEHRHLQYSFVAVARAPAWTSHQAFHGNEHLALAETCVLRYASSSQGTWACWSRRETSFLFGSAVFFLCDSILKSVLAVLSKIAFSFSRRRIRVRVLNAERKISYCVQDDFTRFFQVFFMLRLHVSRYPGYLDIRMSKIRIFLGAFTRVGSNVFGVYTSPDIRMHYTRHTRYV